MLSLSALDSVLQCMSYPLKFGRVESAAHAKHATLHAEATTAARMPAAKPQRTKKAAGGASTRRPLSLVTTRRLYRP